MFDVSQARSLMVAPRGTPEASFGPHGWSYATACTVVVTASLYFAGTFGIAGCRVLASPFLGLEDPSRARLLLDWNRLIGLSPDLIPCLAGLLGACEAVLAALFATSVAQRCRGGRTDRAVFEV